MAENTMTPSEILVAILQRLDTNVRAFAFGMNQPYSKIFDIYRGKTKTFSSNVIKSMRDTYGINEDFISTGKGEILKEDNITVPAVSDEVTASFLKVISTYSNENKVLKEEVAQLKSENKALKARIAELEGGIE